VSVVVPVHDCEGTLAELAARVRAALAGRDVELVFVDDASRDGSREVLGRLAGPEVRVVELAARAGQNAALLAGLRHATRPLAAVLDGDLQDPPEALPLLIARLGASGVQIVFAQREGARRASSRLFKALLRRLFPTLPAEVGLCFALDAEARTALLERGARAGYLLAAIGALKLRAAAVPVRRAERPAGRSAYRGLRRAAHGVRMLAASLRVRVYGLQASRPAPYRVSRVLGGASPPDSSRRK
jgi:undecaprenyl-phosphate 4-deoxy-4-formamido-L-arabinose transferase